MESLLKPLQSFREPVVASFHGVKEDSVGSVLQHLHGVNDALVGSVLQHLHGVNDALVGSQVSSIGELNISSKRFCRDYPVPLEFSNGGMDMKINCYNLNLFRGQFYS